MVQSQTGVGDKLACRRHFRGLRDQFCLNPLAKQQAEQAIVTHLGEFLSNHPGVWASYQAHGSEVHLSSLSHSMAYPVLEGQTLRFYRGPATHTNRFGILEPDPSQSEGISVENLAGVLVPGLAFDCFGNRLGQGKGFYDRALQSYQGIKIGIAFAVQFSREPLPCDAHDVAVTHLITEQGWMSLLRKDHQCQKQQ